MFDSQDQHVSLGGSALDRNLVNKDMEYGWYPEGQQKEFATYLSTVEGASRSDVPTTVIYTTEGEKAQTEDINNASKKACKCLRK